jgi:SAM-dependent methyltransferase
MGILAKLHSVATGSPWLVAIGRKITGRQVHNSKPFINAVRQKHGLEIGGTSVSFGDTGILPLYRHVGSLDNAVYSASSLFPNDPHGSDFQFHSRKPVGRNFILESSALSDLKDGAYDFVLSSHSLEHCANPIKALKEWQRVLRPGGAVVVILPHYRYTL